MIMTLKINILQLNEQPMKYLNPCLQWILQSIEIALELD